MELIVVLLVAGAALLVLEPFFPHFVAGLAGLVCWCVAVASAYATFGFNTGNWILLGVLVAGVGGAFFYVRQLPRSRIARPFSSRHTLPNSDAARPHLLNQSGVALSPLRPGGVAQIAGERVDVVSEGEAIERGVPVKVIAVQGARVVVRPA